MNPNRGGYACKSLTRVFNALSFSESVIRVETIVKEDREIKLRRGGDRQRGRGGKIEWFRAKTTRCS